MKTLAGFSGEASFTHASLSQFSARQLRQLAGYEEGVTSLSPKMKEFLGNRELAGADRDFILSVADDVDLAKVTVPGSYEEHVFAKKGDVLHYQDKSILTFADGTTSEVRNRLVPIPPEIEMRPGAEVLTEFTCAAFDVTDGRVDQIVNQATWRERFLAEETAIITAGLPACKEVTEIILQSHPSWKNVKTSSKTMHGPTFFKFFMEATGTCDWGDYLSAHTVWSTRFLKYAQVVKEEVAGPNGEKQIKKKLVQRVRIDESGKKVPFLETKSCQLITPVNLSPEVKKGYDKVVSLSGCGPVLLKGPFKTLQNFPSSATPTLEAAYTAYQLGQLFRGGPKRGIGCMVSSAGYTALQSANTRRICTLLSLSLPLLNKGEKVQIYSEVSDVVLLNSSLQTFVPGRKWNLVVTEKDYYKLDDVAKDLVTRVPDENAISIRFLDVTVPTVGSSQTTETVTTKSNLEFLARARGGHKEFVAIMPVLSASIWDDCYVYAYRSPWDFSCVVTNSEKVSGHAISLNKKTWEERPNVVMSEPKMLWKSVIDTNIRFNTIWMSQQAFFSPVSNLVIPPKKGYAAILSAEGELQYTFVMENTSVLERGRSVHGDEIVGVDLVVGAPTIDEVPVRTNQEKEKVVTTTTTRVENVVMGDDLVGEALDSVKFDG